jgi:hypothetical protein
MKWWWFVGEDALRLNVPETYSTRQKLCVLLAFTTTNLVIYDGFPMTYSKTITNGLLYALIKEQAQTQPIRKQTLNFSPTSQQLPQHSLSLSHLALPH